MPRRSESVSAALSWIRVVCHVLYVGSEPTCVLVLTLGNFTGLKAKQSKARAKSQSQSQR